MLVVLAEALFVWALSGDEKRLLVFDRTDKHHTELKTAFRRLDTVAEYRVCRARSARRGDCGIVAPFASAGLFGFKSRVCRWYITAEIASGGKQTTEETRRGEGAARTSPRLRRRAAGLLHVGSPSPPRLFGRLSVEEADVQIPTRFLPYCSRAWKGPTRGFSSSSWGDQSAGVLTNQIDGRASWVLSGAGLAVGCFASSRMYKVSQAASSLPRTTISSLSLQKSMVLNKNPKSRHPELCFSSRISSSSDDKLFNSVKPFDISKSIWVNHKPAESARYEDIPAQKPADPELTKALDNAWQNFLTDENGEPDENIVTVQFESTPMPHGFVPLDVDKFMEKRLLAVLNIDIEV